LIATAIPPSRVDPFSFRGHEFFVKRDDLIDPLLSGNKYRKLYSLIHTPAAQYKRLVSYGGSQSNAMLSIAALCHRKNWQFHYTTKPLPQHLKHQPTGNLKMACELGMRLHEVSHAQYATDIAALASASDPTSLYIPQGGADPIARPGIEILAQEIRQWWQTGKHPGNAPLHLVTPSGTGTTASYLARAMPDACILTTPSVGDKAYLAAQISMLGSMPENIRILESRKKHHFAKPYPELLSIHNDLQDAGITFDLIYASHMWLTLLEHLDAITGTILYIHSGGLLGNQTMLARYRHKSINANAPIFYLP